MNQKFASSYRAYRKLEKQVQVKKYIYIYKRSSKIFPKFLDSTSTEKLSKLYPSYIEIGAKNPRTRP